MTKLNIKAKALAQPAQVAPVAEDNQKAFNALLAEIAHIRQGVRGVRGLVNDALRLALKDYLLHNNRNSLQQLVCTPCDYGKGGRKIYLYNLYNVKDYLHQLGLVLSMTAKEGFSIYFSEHFTKPALAGADDFASWYEKNAYSNYTPPKREQAKKAPANWEQIKQGLPALTQEQKAVLFAWLADNT